MVSAVLAAFAVLVVGALLVVVLYLRVRADRRTEAILQRVDDHLEAVSTSVARAFERVVDARGLRPQLLPTLDFDGLVDSLLAELATRTGADAVVLRTEGPGRRPVVASVGGGVAGELLERTFEPPGGRAFRAAAIDWTYAPLEDLDAPPFRSALVAPFDRGHLPGAVAVFSSAHDAFRAEQTAALRALVDAAEAALANARRFADVEARAFVDPVTGVPDRRGYELELEREVARARRSGRPLTVAIVALDESSGSARGGNGLGDLARLVGRVTRGSDISCRRGGRELALLLPGTREPDATRLAARLRDEARRALGRSQQTTFAVGLAEWRPNESVEALDARAAAALSHPLVAVAGTPHHATTPSTATATGHSGADVDVRADAVDALEHRMVETYGDHSLTLVVLVVAGLDEVTERRGREVADTILADLARHLDDHVGDGSVHRLGRETFALVLSGSAADAEALLGTLQADISSNAEASGVRLSAGVTEIVESDDAHGALARAEHASWQARQAGPGTVVVALPASKAPGSS